MRTERRHILGFALLLTGCGSTAVVPSNVPQSSASAMAAAPESSKASSPTMPGPTAADSPTESASIGWTAPDGPPAVLDAWQSARVRVDGLAVRTGPASTYPLVAGYQWDAAANTEVLATDAVRVNNGYFLWIEGGLLVIDGIPWYRVGNTQRQTGVAPDELLKWDADGDEFRHDYGWVAGGNGTSSFLVADDPPPPRDEPVHGRGPDPYAILSGIGNGGTDSFEANAPVGIRWYAADPEGQTCHFTITLEPGGIQMVSSSIETWAGGDDFWPRDFETPLVGDHWVEIETDCSWSLRVVPIQG